jgi:hypothetical protein
MSFAYQVPFFILVGFIHMPHKFTIWDRRLYFPFKEDVLRIFIAIRNPSSSAGFEPAYIRSNGKHANH